VKKHVALRKFLLPRAEQNLTSALAAMIL